MATLALSSLLTVLLLGAAPLAQAFVTPFIPLNWTTLSACAVDNPARIIAGDITSQVANNTPATCVASCAALGFGYAGVEFGDECHCGTAINGVLEDAPISDCSIACAGDSTLSCGGSWRIQLYTFPALRPGSWAYQGCIVDTSDAPAFPNPSAQLLASNLDLVNQCLQACSRLGFSFAGVENAGECQCSSAGLAETTQKAVEAECNSLCPLPGNAGFEFCGGVDRLGVYKFTG